MDIPESEFLLAMQKEWHKGRAWDHKERVVRAALGLQHWITAETELHAVCPGSEAESLVGALCLARNLKNLLDEEKAYNGAEYAHLNSTSQDVLGWLGRLIDTTGATNGV